MPPKSCYIFKKQPTQDIVLNILNKLGFDGLTDAHVFTEDDLPTDVDYSSLEPFYYACKWNRLHKNVKKRNITIIRNLIRLYKYDLMIIKQKYRYKYRMVPQTDDFKSTAPVFLITFD